VPMGNVPLSEATQPVISIEPPEEDGNV